MKGLEGYVVLCSGGLDSTTLLWDVWKDKTKHLAAAISVNYGQRHARELQHARELVRRMEIEHVVIDFPSFGRCLKSSSQTSMAVPVPHGHYEAENMKVTVVPNRNMVLLASAAAIAMDRGARWVAYAAHGGDHAIYPDCRPAFVHAMNDVLLTASDDRHVGVHAPYLGYTKANIVTRGEALGVPFRLTYSCYEGRPRHCGKCGTCVERKEAFALAKIPDPTLYEGKDGGIL